MKEDFNKTLEKYEPILKQMCKALANNFRKVRIESEDLMQEARLKLWQLWKTEAFNIEDKKIVQIAIKNHLLKYIRNTTTVMVRGKRLIKPIFIAELKGLLEDYF